MADFEPPGLREKLRWQPSRRRCAEAAEQGVPGQSQVKFIDHIQCGQLVDQLPTAFAMQVADLPFPPKLF